MAKMTKQTVKERAAKLLAGMTLEEKAAQLSAFILNGHPEEMHELVEGRVPDTLKEYLKDGLGAISGVSQPFAPNESYDAEQTARVVNTLQKYVKEHTRQGIPLLVHDEALHGNCGRGATSFPQAVALASTWDEALLEEVFTIAAKETRARGATHVLAPVCDVVRDPRYGRSEECYGEDPYLASRMAVAAVKGFQGLKEAGDMFDEDRVAATAKHFVAYGQPESGINAAPAACSYRTVVEMFFPPFESVVKEAHIAAVMPSYTDLEGTPMHGNGRVINGILRGEWGFDGVVTSDYNGVVFLRSNQGLVEDDAGAAKRALESGVDMEFPRFECYRYLPELVRSGRLSEKTLDEAVMRVLTLKLRLGLFEKPFVDESKAGKIVGAPEHSQVALKAARESIILLKNDGLLPLDDSALGKVAVIGPNAGTVHVGGYSRPKPQGTSILDGIRQAGEGKFEVGYAKGCGIIHSTSVPDDLIAVAEGMFDIERWGKVRPSDPEDDERLIAEAVEVAADCDVIVLAVGGNEATSRESWANREGDRCDLTPLGKQEELAERLAALGKPIITVVVGGRPLALGKLAGLSNALIEYWYAGERGGEALAEILFGKVCPSGKLTVSLPRSVGHLPDYYCRRPSALNEFYLFGENSALYPFGFGLSYTTFGYSDVIAEERYAAGEPVRVSVDVTNTGKRTGTEIVQLYLRKEVAPVTRPCKLLKRFARVELAPGETKRVTFELDKKALSYIDENYREAFEPGAFDIMIGPDSERLNHKRILIS